jgi:hypothetical protein
MPARKETKPEASVLNVLEYFDGMPRVVAPYGEFKDGDTVVVSDKMKAVLLASGLFRVYEEPAKEEIRHE